jgi:hypothetical protein
VCVLVCVLMCAELTLPSFPHQGPGGEATPYGQSSLEVTNYDTDHGHIIP